MAFRHIPRNDCTSLQCPRQRMDASVFHGTRPPITKRARFAHERAPQGTAGRPEVVRRRANEERPRDKHVRRTRSVL